MSAKPSRGITPIGGGAEVGGGSDKGGAAGEAPAAGKAPANMIGTDRGKGLAEDLGFRGTIHANVSVTVNGVGAMDPEAVAQLARVEIDRAQRRQLDAVRRGLYD